MDEPARDEEAGLTGGRGPIRQRSSISSFLFITFLLFMLTSHNGDEFLARHQYQDALRSLTYQLSNYTAWMNGTSTNFTVHDQSPLIPPLLDLFNIKGSQLDSDQASYYSNITGFIHGSTRLHNITRTALLENDTALWNSIARNYVADVNATDVVERIGAWNWTASNKLAISVVEKLPAHSNGTIVSESIALVHGRIELTDANTSEDLRLEFEGVHFISTGSIYGFAEPIGRHIDIRLLPALVPVGAKNETARLIEPELNVRLNKLKGLIDAGVVDQDLSNDEPPKSRCSFTFYAQLHPAQVPQHLMQELEEEIQRPTGIWTISLPKLSVNALLISKECGIMFEIIDNEGLRSRIFFRKVTTYAGVAGLVYLTLLILYCRQSERSRTPSGLARVSRWSFLAQATVDSVSFAGHITFAILAEGRPSLTLIAPAFLACILFVYEAQFSVLIHQIQAPENVVVPPPPPLVPIPTPPSSPLPLSPSNANESDAIAPVPTITNQTTTTPQPAAPAPTAQPDSPSFFQFLVHHVRTDPQARLWITLFIFLTFVVRVILSPTLSMIFVAVTYSLIWLPQIFRSLRRGRSSGLSKEYVIGTTLCRLYLALYFLACPKNVLEVEPRRWSYLLAAFVCLQCCLVMLQDIFGPTFFLPERYQTTKSYNYHPSLPLPDSEAPEQFLGDCAICMEAIIVENRGRGPSEKGKYSEWDVEGGGIGMGTRQRSLGSTRLFDAMQMGAAIARKNYSLAPCNHLFHTECLERWLAIKNICPHCRRPLPPL